MTPVTYVGATISQPISSERRGRNLARQAVPEPFAGPRDAQGFQTPSPRVHALGDKAPLFFAQNQNYTSVVIHSGLRHLGTTGGYGSAA